MLLKILRLPKYKYWWCVNCGAHMKSTKKLKECRVCKDWDDPCEVYRAEYEEKIKARKSAGPRLVITRSTIRALRFQIGHNRRPTLRLKQL